MPTYSMSAPNGKTYDIEGPAGATEAQVRAEILRRDPTAGMPPAFKKGERESYISAQRKPSVPKAGALNPSENPYEELKKTGLRPQKPTVGGVVGPLAVMAAPFASPAIGAGARVARPALEALEAWAAKNPAQAKLLLETLKVAGYSTAGYEALKRIVGKR